MDERKTNGEEGNQRETLKPHKFAPPILQHDYRVSQKGEKEREGRGGGGEQGDRSGSQPR